MVTHGWPGSIARVPRHHRPVDRPAGARRRCGRRVRPRDPLDAGVRPVGPDPRAGLDQLPDRGGMGRADAPARLRALRRGRERRRLDDLAGDRSARSRARRRCPRHPDLRLPVRRSLGVRRPDAGGDDRARDPPVVLREQDVVQQGVLGAAADASRTGSPTRRSDCSPGTRSSSARTSTRTSRSPT